jgi:hypothetical protein
MKKVIFKTLSRFFSLFCLCLLLALPCCLQAQGTNKVKVLRDSTIKYGIEIEPFLKSINNQKIVEGFNYSPYINKFLKEHKYVKFPPYPLTIGTDNTFSSFKCHLTVNSGNRIYFPKGSVLVCPRDMMTNNNMVYVDGKVNDVFIEGITLHGSKFNQGYQTSQWGTGILLNAPSNIIISNATIIKSSGDGLAVRTNWGKQSEDITINGAKIIDATRVGMLVTGIINGTFRNIHIEGTGEEAKDKVVKPQNGLSFEPNDCTSKYVNCKFYNLETKNNLGSVLTTANFYHLFANNTCGKNNVDVTINNWNDIITDPACYGATFDVATADLNAMTSKYETKEISGKFIINNPTLVRNTKNNAVAGFFFKGKDELLGGGINYQLNNLKLVSQGTAFSPKSANATSKMKSTIRSSRKVLIR